MFLAVLAVTVAVADADASATTSALWLETYFVRERGFETDRQTDRQTDRVQRFSKMPLASAGLHPTNISSGTWHTSGGLRKGVRGVYVWHIDGIKPLPLAPSLSPAPCPIPCCVLALPRTQEWELTKGSLPWVGAVRRWAEMQDGQRILLTTPSVLVGFRVEVYRAEGTTQWYTAVIVGYNESTKDLTVTDDTVLEDHNEDPSLVQMRLIGDGVVESIMRGEVVGMTPRRSRSSTALTHALVVVSEIQFRSIIKLVTRLVIMMMITSTRETQTRKEVSWSSGKQQHSTIASNGKSSESDFAAFRKRYWSKYFDKSVIFQVCKGFIYLTNNLKKK
ncbi:hypothetical protein M0802_008482 [Mischocyttarus mexicanus]|nr:hypothetical protein M0802_008482 [Mischocyttarus mexicanus]